MSQFDIPGDTQMARRRANVINPPPKGFVEGAPREAVLAEMGRLIQDLMVKKNMNQSDLARAAAKYMPDKTFARDNISQYVRGLAAPGPVRLNAIAKALGKKPDEILPTRGISAVDARMPPLGMRGLADGNVFLQINQAVPQDVALKIIQMLKRD